MAPTPPSDRRRFASMLKHSGVVPRAVIPGAVGHALGERIGDLVLQTVTHLFLQHGLQRVVPHVAIGLGAETVAP